MNDRLDLQRAALRQHITEHGRKQLDEATFGHRIAATFEAPKIQNVLSVDTQFRDESPQNIPALRLKQVDAQRPNLPQIHFWRQHNVGK